MCLFCKSSTPSWESRTGGRLAASEALVGFADVILHGGDILTMTAGRPTPAAMSVRNGVVQTLGSLEEVSRQRGRVTRMIDLQGRAVAPGLVIARTAARLSDRLDWKVVKLLRGDDWRKRLNAIPRPIFREPVYIKLSEKSSSPSCDEIVEYLSEAWSFPPILCIDGEENWATNEAMSNYLGLYEGMQRFSRTDLAAKLDQLGCNSQPCVATLSRALTDDVLDSLRCGATTLVDRSFGLRGGGLELEAASMVLERKQKLRLEGWSHRFLREDSRNFDPYDSVAGMVRVGSAALQLSNGGNVDEVKDLLCRGWRLIFHPRDSVETKQLTTLAQDAANQTQKGVGSIWAYIPAGTSPADVRSLNASGVLVRCDDLDDTSDSPDVWDLLVRQTSAIAKHLGLAERCGVIDVGRRADLVLLEADPRSSNRFVVSETWVGGIPVGKSSQ